MPGNELTTGIARHCIPKNDLRQLPGTQGLLVDLGLQFRKLAFGQTVEGTRWEVKLTVEGAP